MKCVRSFFVKLVVITLVVVLVLLTSCGGGKKQRKPDNYNTVEYGGLSFQLPDYYEDLGEAEIGCVYYAEPEEQLTMLTFREIDNTSGSEDEFSTMYELIGEQVVNTQDPNLEKIDANEFKTSQGVQVGEIDYHTVMSITPIALYMLSESVDFPVSEAMDIPMDQTLMIINNTECNSVILVSLYQSENSEYDYSKAFKKMVDEAVVVGQE